MAEQQLNLEQWQAFDLAQMTNAVRTFNNCVSSVIEHVLENSNNDKKRSVTLTIEFTPDGEVILATPKIKTTLPQGDPIVLETVEGTVHQENFFVRRTQQTDWMEE